MDEENKEKELEDAAIQILKAINKKELLAFIDLNPAITKIFLGLKDLDTISKIVDYEIFPINILIAQNNSVNEDIIRKIYKQSNDLATTPKNEILLTLAYNKNTPSDILMELYNSLTKDTKLHIISHNNFSSDNLHKIIESKDIKEFNKDIKEFNTSILLEIAKQKLNPETFELIYNSYLAEKDNFDGDSKSKFRIEFLGKKSRSLKDIYKYQSSHSLLMTLAENTNTPKHILKTLSHNKNNDILRKLAANTNTPSSILFKLAKDSSASVQAAIALNPKTTAKTLRLLINNNNKAAYDAIYHKNTPAKERLNGLTRMIDNNFFIRGIAQNDRTPQSILIYIYEYVMGLMDSDVNPPTGNEKYLYAHECTSIMSSLCTNKNIPEWMMLELSNKSDLFVLNLISNPNVTTKCLEHLSDRKDLSDFHISSIMNHNNISKKTMQRLESRQNMKRLLVL